MAVALDRWAQWLLETRHGGDEGSLRELLDVLAPIRDRVLDGADVGEGDVVLDVGCGDGLVAFGALDRVGETGRVLFADVSQDLLDRCAEAAAGDERCRFLHASLTDLREVPDGSVDAVTLRSVLIYVPERPAAFAELHRVLRPGGRLSLFEPLNSFAYPGPAEQWGPWDVTEVLELVERVKDVYRAVHDREGNSMHDFVAEDLAGWAERAGFREVTVEATYELAPAAPVPWDAYERRAANPLVPSLAEAIDSVLDADEARRLRSHLRARAEAGDGVGRQAHAYLRAVR